MIQFDDHIFSDGLVQPPTIVYIYMLFESPGTTYLLVSQCSMLEACSMQAKVKVS